ALGDRSLSVMVSRQWPPNLQPRSDVALGSRSFVGNTRLSHPVDDPRAPVKIVRVVGDLRGTEARKIERHVDREAGRRCGTGLLQTTKVRQGRAELEIRHGETAVAADALSQPGDGLLVAPERILGEAYDGEPGVSETVKRAQPQGLADVAFGLLGPAKMQDVE